MLLSPTRRAAPSVCPFAIAFQTRTIAMRGGSPARMRAVRYSGRSGRKIHARANMRNGPRIQFWTRLTAMIRRFDARRGRSSYRTRARGGYIIQIRPTAIGIETPDQERASRLAERPGTVAPRPAPAAIARQIHRGGSRASHGSFSGSSAGTAGPRGRLAEAALRVKPSWGASDRAGTGRGEG